MAFVAGLVLQAQQADLFASDAVVRSRLAEDARCPSWLLSQLAGDDSVPVRLAVCRNPLLSPALADVIVLSDVLPDVRRVAARRAPCSTEALLTATFDAAVGVAVEAGRTLFHAVDAGLVPLSVADGAAAKAVLLSFPDAFAGPDWRFAGLSDVAAALAFEFTGSVASLRDLCVSVERLPV
jgi:hypothetical protein